MSLPAVIVIIFVMLSTILSLAYLVWGLLKKSSEMLLGGLIMLCAPIVGPLYYFGQFILRKFLRQELDMQIEDIGFSKDRAKRTTAPDEEKEMQSVPLEEVFIVSANSVKRRSLLDELKRENITDYSIIRKACENDDPEVAHYAAAAIAAVKSKFENRLRRYSNEYNELYISNDGVLVRKYSDFILKYIDSGILDGMEERKYCRTFLDLMGEEKAQYMQFVSGDYSVIIDKALFLHDYSLAEEWAQVAIREFPNAESSYLNLMKVYYRTNRTDVFIETLDNLKNSEIRLSDNGLSLVRFFMEGKTREKVYT